MRVWMHRPTAWLPFAIALAALALVLGVAVTAGVAPHAEEGAPARIFQALLVAQAALVGLFAIQWVPRAPRAAASIVAAQVLATALPVAVLLVLESQG